MEIRHRPRRCAHTSGFTLLELMITLAIAAILLTLVAPAFAQLMANTRITAAVNEFVAHLNLARNEAITRGERIALCPSADNASCLSTPDWHEGGLLFVDANWNSTLDAGDELLRVMPATAPPVTVTSSVARKRIVYEPDGTVTGNSNLTVRFCDATGSAAPKTVFVSLPGRPRSDDKESDGTPVRCP